MTPAPLSFAKREPRTPTLLPPAELAALERLAPALRAPPGPRAGAATGRSPGRGFDLLGLDPLRDGDSADARHIDLGARLRTGVPWLRTFLDDGAGRVLVALDASRSLGPAKLVAARRLAAAQLVVARARHDDARLCLLGEGPRPREPLTASFARLASLTPLAAPPLAPCLAELAAQLRAGDRLLLLTDLADPTPPDTLLAPLGIAARCARISIALLIADTDLHLPDGAARITAPEAPTLSRPREGVVDNDARFAGKVVAWRAAALLAATRAGLLLTTHDGSDLVGATARLWS